MVYKRLLLAIVILFSSYHSSFASNDSIEIYLKNLNEYKPNKRTAILNKISDYYKETDLVKASYYSELAKAIALSNNDSSGLADAYYNLGYIQLLKGENSNANKNLTKAYNLYYITNNRQGLAHTSNNLASIFRYSESFDKSLTLHLKALEIFNEIKDTNGIIGAKNNIGILYRSIENYEKSIKYYNEALNLALLSNSNLLSTIYNSIGSYYWYKQNNDSALAYYNKALAIIPSTMLLKERYCAALNNIGNVYRSIGKLDSSLHYYNKSLLKSKEFGFINLASITLKNFGIVYTKQGNIDKALSCLKESISLAQQSNLKRILSEDYSLISGIYSKQGNYKEALYYYKLHSDIHDSIFVDENIDRINQLEVENILQQKEKDNAILSKNIAEQNLEIQQNRNIFIVFGLIIVFMAVVSIISLRYFKLSKQSAKELQIMNEELENRVNLRTLSLQKEIREHNQTAAALIKAKEKAEESDRLKSSFLANLSHEIRTPMNAIQGFTDLLKMPNLTDEKKDIYISTIKKSGNKLLLIINDIIEISKIDAGQIVPHFSPINLNDFLVDLFNTLHVTVPDDKKLELRLVNSDQNPSLYISTDEVKLLQIMTNLINNAIKFTEEGSVNFGYEILNEKEIKFFVQDTGIGIDPKFKQVIFERFRRIESDLAIMKGGSGLGLAISKAYVEMLGGKIELDSEVGKGSYFSFTIPLIVAEKSSNIETTTVSKNNNYYLDNDVILIAEDDDINYLYFKEIVSNYHFTIIRACTGKEAVDYCSKHDFLVVLMDIKMPEMDGFEALKLIKSIKPNLQVIAQTSYALPEDEALIKKSGFDGYITKPINKEELKKQIDLVIKKQGERENV